MNSVANDILNAAERRMRVGGFNGFSFREIAVDVGVKSSSVHYHFPTKENLAAAVVHRYTDEVSKYIDKQFESESDPVKVWAKAFRGTLSDERMCPCVVMGAGALDLPEKVAEEVKRYFKMCIDKLTASGLSPNEAAELLSTITGAMVVSSALNDISAYDRATSELVRSGLGKGKKARSTAKSAARRK